MEAPSLFIALIAGLVSFLSPCVLPLVPAYIGYMGGSTVMSARAAVAGGNTTASTAAARWTALSHALIFVLGFTIVFVVIIGGLAGAFSIVLKQNIRILQWIMGVLLIVFGLHMIGAINIPFLNYTRRLELRPASNLGYLRSFLIGMGFGIGWTPCIGPTLGIIFTLAINGQEGQAFLPAIAYSMGLGIPFILTALAMGQISAFLKKLTRRTYSLRIGNFTLIDEVNVVSLISGILLIAMGLLVITNSIAILARFGAPIDI
ncbi:MAG TPA: cytochrome c biogenesis protein CcdA [Chloroflexia bacterium]|jgi:cytochrome c-type biogenesis protein